MGCLRWLSHSLEETGKVIFALKTRLASLGEVACACNDSGVHALSRVSHIFDSFSFLYYFPLVVFFSHFL